MINSANKSTISAIFPPDTPIKYVIPKYQREYTWSKENWDDLIDDVNDSDLGHFIGSIICIYKGYNSESQLTYEIIDGQQRLTTVSILYSAIYKTLSNLIDSDNEELKNDLWNLKNRIIQKNNKYSTKLELSTQNYNYSDYKSILNDCGVMVYEEYISNKGNRKIYKSYRHFLSRL